MTGVIQLIIIMGVSGSGKSTVSTSLGKTLGWPVIEGDDYHPSANVQKMANGIPLEDKDRDAWIEAINDAIALHKTSPIILACSALTPFVQNSLQDVKGRTCMWVWLTGPAELILKRLENRADHFMKASMLESQFEALTVPEGAIEFSIDRPIEEVVSEICEWVSKAK